MPIYEISIWIDAMQIYLERRKTREGIWKPWLSAELQGRSFIPVCNGYLNRSSNDLITVCPFSCIPTDFQSLHCSLNDQFLVSPPPPQLFQVSFSFASLKNISSMDRNSWFLWTYIIYFTSCTTHNHVEALVHTLPLPELTAIQKSTLLTWHSTPIYRYSSIQHSSI